MRFVTAVFAGALLAAIGIVSCSSSSDVSNPSSSNGFGGSGGNASNATAAGGDNAGGGITIPDAGADGHHCPAETTCKESKVECGQIGNGCGDVLDCGTCDKGMTCSAGTCVPTCTPHTCHDVGANCGPIGDGCGAMIDCGDCMNGDTCGGGGVPSVCGTGSMCTPTTCADQAVNCGPIGDGCGAVLDCGACNSPDTCGGGGVSSVCGRPPCVPGACQAGQCGPVADGCGGIVQCGGCSQPDTCGGDGHASFCGIPSSCTNLCRKQQTCANPAITTTVTGTVYAPNGVDPLPNAAVYVPNAPVLPFTPGVSCDSCGAPASGSPLVEAVTGVDGKFTLRNVPVGANIPLVIQLGRWRRQVKIANVNACVNNPVAASLTRLPRNKGEGDIPLMAFSTGAVDALECVMRKIGVDDDEFTAETGSGRIHLYEGLTDHGSQNATAGIWASGGAKSANSTTEDHLWTTQAELNRYDMVFFPCQADQANPALRSATAHQNLINYANAGGRIFATHFSYIWLYQTAPFSSTAQWNVEQHPSPPDQLGFINQGFPKGQALAQWLQIVGASAVPGQIQLQVLRHDHNNVVAPSQSWMTIDDSNFPNAIVDYTFNTPVGAPAAQQCGRVLFDDFHVENTSFAPTVGALFPTECAPTGMSPQEKLLEFMIFDLASCITPDMPQGCDAKTCVELGVGCGPAGDGCGGLIQCGDCPAGQSCGGGGIPSQCGAPTCTPRTCQDQGIQCGPAGDGCGNQILCGACSMGQSCGGGGMPGVCGSQACHPESCSDQGVDCGPAGDGCGHLLQCGNCPMGQSCGGGGQPGKCGSPSCTPKTCVELGANCGPVADGCGHVLQCGSCAAPQTCGGGGVANVCGGSGPK